MRRLMLIVLLLLSAAPAFAQTATLPDASDLRMVEVAAGFNRPLFVTHAGDGSGRLFMVEQGGRIWVLNQAQRLDTPFLDISTLVSPDANSFGYTERGLLGLAFSPDYETNGQFFINYTDTQGDTVIARMRVSTDPDVADTAMEVLLTVDQPYPNHNGGNLVFGPDGYLYIGMGDGGSQGDPQGNGQRLDTLLGKLLRIDVSGETGYTIPPDNPFIDVDGARPEIWAYGVRNPWRFTFDRVTGDFLMGDVGGSAWEEIDYQPAGEGAGANYGWSLFEAQQPRANAPADGITMPILSYSHAEGVSVTGGYVYRGAAIPALQGVYLYADFGFGTVWAALPNGDGTWSSSVLLSNTGYTVSSFAEDEAGELYIVNYAGTLLQIAPAS